MSEARPHRLMAPRPAWAWLTSWVPLASRPSVTSLLTTSEAAVRSWELAAYPSSSVSRSRRWTCTCAGFARDAKPSRRSKPRSRAAQKVPDAPIRRDVPEALAQSPHRLCGGSALGGVGLRAHDPHRPISSAPDTFRILAPAQAFGASLLGNVPFVIACCVLCGSIVQRIGRRRAPCCSRRFAAAGVGGAAVPWLLKEYRQFSRCCSLVQCLICILVASFRRWRSGRSLRDLSHRGALHRHLARALTPPSRRLRRLRTCAMILTWLTHRPGGSVGSLPPGM